MLRRAASRPVRRFEPRARVGDPRQAGCRSRAAIEFRSRSSKKARRDRRAHSPAWYDSPRASFGARGDAAEEALVEDLELVLGAGAEAPLEPSGSVTTSVPPSSPGSTRSRIATRHALERGQPRARRAGGEPRRRCSSRAPSPSPARTAACGGTGRAQPDLERLPVDERDHLQRHQRVAHEEAGERSRSSARAACRRARPGAACGRPRAPRSARRPSPPARRTRTGSAGRARRRATRAGASRARSGASCPGAAPAAARRRCCSAPRPCTRARRPRGSTSRS